MLWVYLHPQHDNRKFIAHVYAMQYELYSNEYINLKPIDVFR